MSRTPVIFNPPESGVEPGLLLKYNAEPTMARFHNSSARIRAIVGPVGSGKTSACFWELFIRAMKQRPYKGVRRSKWCVIRNTFPELLHTSWRTFTSWFPIMERPQQGYSMTANMSKPMVAKLFLRLPDNTTVDAEFIFMALDTPEDADKLKSLELTGAYCNEVSQIDKHIFQTVNERIGRFPANKDGGFDYCGLWCDTNPPDTSSWFFELFELEKPPGHEIFHQPPGILELPREKPTDPIVYVPNMGQGEYPAAENISNLGEGYQYYMTKTYGATREYCRVMLMGKYGNLADGKVVYTEYQDDEHCATENLTPYRSLPLILGIDYGLTPACAIGQLTPRGTLQYIDELVCGLSERDLKTKTDKARYHGDMGIRNFAVNVLRPFLQNNYGGMTLAVVGDPAGTQRSQTNETTCAEELQAAGFSVESARTNNFLARKEAVEGFMMKRNGLKVSPKCLMLREAFQSKYRYRMVKKPTGEGFTTEPEKNLWSHISDAAQYVALWAEGSGAKGSANEYGQRQSARPVVSSGYNAYT